MSAEPLLLVVDDEAGILRLIKLELSAQGFRVITAYIWRGSLETCRRSSGPTPYCWTS